MKVVMFFFFFGRAGCPGETGFNLALAVAFQGGEKYVEMIWRCWRGGERGFVCRRRELTEIWGHEPEAVWRTLEAGATANEPKD